MITSKTVIEEIDGNEDIMPVQFAFTKFADLAEYMDDRSKSVGEYANSPSFVFLSHIVFFSTCLLFLCRCPRSGDQFISHEDNH